MTTESVRVIFKIYILCDDLKLPGDCYVNVDVFAKLFESASENPTYQELVDIDEGKKGYLPFFEQCKLDDVLN